MKYKVVIDMDEAINKAFDEIEQEIQEKHPYRMILGLDDILELDATFTWYTKLLSLGCSYRLMDKDANMMEIKSGKILIDVPSSTEIGFKLETDKIHPLCGRDAAELCKGIFHTVVNTLCIRVPHEPIYVKTSYKESDIDINYDCRVVLDAIAKNIVSDIAEKSDEDFDRFMVNRERLNDLARFGIKLTSEDKSVADIMEMGTMNVQQYLIMSVPSSSRYRIFENEICGEYAIEFAKKTLMDVIGITADKFKKIEIRDEHWGEKEYNEIDEQIEAITSFIKRSRK